MDIMIVFKENEKERLNHKQEIPVAVLIFREEKVLTQAERNIRERFEKPWAYAD